MITAGAVVVASTMMQDNTDFVIAVTGLVTALAALVGSIVAGVKVLKELRTNTQITTAAAIAADSTHQQLTEKGVQ